MPASIKDVAGKAGVSIATVSRVLSGKGYISGDAREKVVAAVKALGYRPKGVQPARDADWTLPMTLRVDAAAHRLVFDNPTPYQVTVVDVTSAKPPVTKKLSATLPPL